MVFDPVSFSHIPVLLPEVLDALAPKEGNTYIDATFGGGGYTQGIFEHTHNVRVLGIDRDKDAITRGETLQKKYGGRLLLAHGPFSHIPTMMAELGMEKISGIVFDLGVSSFQIDDPSRGFSFRFNAPLAMTMGCNDVTAFDVVNYFDEKEIADILYAGDERHARRIARKIADVRKQAPINTTLELVNIVRSVVPKSKDLQNPATLTFQALRIFVNKELIELETALEFCKNILEPHGRVVFVTFHSLEDRLVKKQLRTLSGKDPQPSRHMPMLPLMPSYFTLPKGQPILPSAEECRNNPRARSAKLRYGIYTGNDTERSAEKLFKNMGEV